MNTNWRVTPSLGSSSPQRLACMHRPPSAVVDSAQAAPGNEAPSPRWLQVSVRMITLCYISSTIVNMAVGMRLASA